MLDAGNWMTFWVGEKAGDWMPDGGHLLERLAPLYFFSLIIQQGLSCSLDQESG